MNSFELKPMEPVPWPEPFDSWDWLAQVKWDGVRILAVIDDDGVRLTNRKGYTRTAQYPELMALSDLLPTGVVLDGEVVALAQGKPSFHATLQRDFSKRPVSIQAKQAELPITFFVFDLLYLRGNDVRQSPLLERQKLLERIWPGNQPYLHLVESFPSGQQLFTAVQAQGLEGVVLKHRHSAYVPGKRSTDWRKVKVFREVTCLVGGYTRRQGQFSALLLGLRSQEHLVYVGAAGSGMSQKDWQALRPFLSTAERGESPFQSTPVCHDRELHWLEPVLAVRVRFMEWSADLKLRAPVVVGFQAAESVDCTFTGQGV